MVDALSGLTDFLVASPENLHLSHLSDRPLQYLEKNPDISPQELAHKIAEESFKRLSSFLQTAVTVAVYDINQTSDYIDSLARTYRNHLQNFNQASLFLNNNNCESLREFDKPLPNQGVTLFYKPAEFGSRSSTNQHSGWGCKK